MKALTDYIMSGEVFFFINIYIYIIKKILFLCIFKQKNILKNNCYNTPKHS